MMDELVCEQTSYLGLFNQLILSPSSKIDKVGCGQGFDVERSEAAFDVFSRAPQSLLPINRLPLLSVDSSSVIPIFLEVRIETSSEKNLMEGVDENYSDEELIESILENETFIQMHPVNEYKVRLKILTSENAKPRKIVSEDF